MSSSSSDAAAAATGAGDEDVHRHQFRDLTRNWQATAAATVPLVLWQDQVGGPERQPVNRHEDFCSLYIVRRGRGAHVIDGARYAIARGDVYAMGPGMSHHFEGCDSLETDTFHFLPSVFDRETLDALAAIPGFHSLFVAPPAGGAAVTAAAAGRAQERWLHLNPTQYGAAQAAIAELRAEWQAGALPAGALLTRALFFRLLVLLSRAHAENRSSPGGGSGSALAQAPAGFAGAHEETVAAAVRHLEEHFTEPLRIEQVAARVFLSPDRFTEVFAQAMGRTPRDYLRHLRVEHAKMLLATTDLPMSEIAAASGFAEPAYFTRVLRAATGMAPSAYRRRAAGK